MGKAGKLSMKAKINPLKKEGPRKGKVLKKPFAKKGTLALTKKNLNKLQDMTLQEKVEKATEEEDPEAAAESLKKMMSKQEHSKVWGQHQTFLKSQSKQQQKEHEGKTKKEKSQAVAMWFLEKKAPKFHHQSQEVGAQTSHLQREKWVSWKKLLEEWTEDEIWAHLDSGRIRGRESSTWGVWEYTDTQDVEKLKKAFKGNTWKQGMEYQPTSEDELVFQEQWSKGASSMLQRLGNTGHALQKGNEKGKGKSKGKGKGKGKAGDGLQAIRDKEEGASEKEEGNSEKEDPDEAMKEAMKKAKRARDMTGGQIQDLEDALVKASTMLTKQGKQKGFGQQQELTSLAKRLKDVCAKQHLGLPALKELLVEVTKANKAAKDHVKELVQGHLLRQLQRQPPVELNPPRQRNEKKIQIL